MSSRLSTLLVLANVLGVASASPQEPEASAPTLYSLAVAIIGDPAQAWPAVHQLRALRLSSAKERAGAKKLAESWGEQLPGLKGSAAVVRAHAIGALGENADAAAAALARGCRTGSDASVRLACALALGEIGDAGVKAAVKELQPDDLVGGALICAALARPGARAPTAVKALEKSVKDAEQFRGYVLCEPAIVVLEILQQDVDKPLEQRESLRGDIEYPVHEGLNWFGILEAAPHSFLLTFGDLGVMQNVSIEDFAIPERLRQHRTGSNLADMYADMLGHIARVTGELLPALADGSIPTLDEYTKRTRSWTLTIQLLLEVEERYVPKPGK